MHDYSTAKNEIVGHVTLDRRHPPVTIDDLALMLEIEILRGFRKEFRHRLQRALNDACHQGRQRH